MINFGANMLKGKQETYYWKTNQSNTKGRIKNMFFVHTMKI